MHFRLNLHSVGDWGRSGATNPGRTDPTDEEGVIAAGAAGTEGADVDDDGGTGG